MATAKKKDCKQMGDKTIKKFVVWSIFAMILLLVTINSLVVIGGGQRGVIFSKLNGVQENILDEGIHFKKPFIDAVIKFDVRTLKATSKTASTSFDQQTVAATVVLNFHLNYNSINTLYQEVGTNYGDKIIIPALEGSIKSSMAKFKAEELIKKRDEVNLAIVDSLKEKLSTQGIIIEAINIIDIDFSDEYDAAIEAKVTAEQEVKTETNKLEKEKIFKEQTIVIAEADKEKRILESEAKSQSILLEGKANKERKILEAQANAEAILLVATSEAQALRIKQEAAKDSDEVIKLKYLERWDGVLPKVMSGESSEMIMMVSTEED